MQRFLRHPLTLIITLALGIALCALSTQRFTLTPILIFLLLVLACLSLFPAIHRPLHRMLDRLRAPSPRRRFMIACAIALVATVYLLGTALMHDRALYPKSHDENSYIIQTRIFATGRLWMPMHPLADFFESFHILTRPVYAPIYFPGTALMNLPMPWLHLPVYLLPLLFSGAIVGLMYRITAELIDGVAGLLAAMLTISPFWFRINSTLVMSQSPAMLLGLLMIWSWLRWRQSPGWRWTLLIGALAGWAAITRPVDALAFALPIGVAMLLRAWRDKSPLKSLPLLVAGALPFLALQLAFNYGTTGDPLLSPYLLYLRQSQPATTFGYHATDQPPEFHTTLAQKKIYYEQFLGEALSQHRPGHLLDQIRDRLTVTADATLPWRVLLVLIPLSLLGLTTPPRRVIACIPLIFFALYLFNPFYLEHYTIPLIAPLSILLVLGAHVIATTPKHAYVRSAACSFATLSLAALAIAALPELNRAVRDEVTFLRDRALAYRMIDESIDAPAVLLVRFRPGDNTHDEPVYNTDVAWPDDAPVIRAHDLGPQRDLEIAEYYAHHQPRRRFYLFDRATQTLTFLGTAPQVLDALQSPVATTTSSPAASTRASTR